MESLSAAPFAGNDDRVKEIIGIFLPVRFWNQYGFNGERMYHMLRFLSSASGDDNFISLPYTKDCFLWICIWIPTWWIQVTDEFSYRGRKIFSAHRDVQFVFVEYKTEIRHKTHVFSLKFVCKHDLLIHIYIYIVRRVSHKIVQLK